MIRLFLFKGQYDYLNLQYIFKEYYERFWENGHENSMKYNVANDSK